jgi:hypothetical protein
MTLQNVAQVAVDHDLHIELMCTLDGYSLDGSNHPYTDGGATIVAIPSASGDQALARTTTSILQSLDEQAIVQLPLGPGNWLVGFKATAVEGGSFTTVSCRVDLAPTATGGVEVGAVGPRRSSATFAGYGWATGPGTATLYCAAGGPNAYLDPAALIWARKVASVVTGGSGCGGGVGSDATLVVINSHGCLVGPNGAAPTLVGEADLAPGRWIILGSETIRTNREGTLVRCAHSGDPKSTSASLLRLNDTHVSVMGYLALSTATHVSIACGVDSGYTGNATVVGAQVFLRI